MAEDDHYYSSKRKHSDPSPPRRQSGFSSPPLAAAPPQAAAQSYNSVPPPPADEIQLAKQRAQMIAARLFSETEGKRPRFDNGDEAAAAGGIGGGFGGVGSGDRGFGHSSGFDQRPPSQPASSQVGITSFSTYGYQGTSKKIEIPNGRVGVIIGKAGETIKYLQVQSGAKIQVTRDMDVDPNSDTRPVELSGTPEQISKAEQMIGDVLAEADAGASNTISARRFGAPQAGAEQFQMKIGNNKVGLVIGKGGETIKSMQAKSGAHIKVVPLHLPPGETLTERTVFIDGTKEQIEIAKQLVNEVISENRVRNPMSGGYPQQGYRPPRPATNWGQPGAPPVQQPGYGYMQPGAYPGAPPQYGMSQPPYGSYPPQASGGYQSGWDQSSNQPVQQPPPGTGYDYYSQQQPPQQPQPVSGSSAPSDASSYNYGQPPAYTASQGSYGESAYQQQTGGQQAYGVESYSTGYQGYSQPMSAAQTGYDHQQSYSAAPVYGAAANTTQDGSVSSYGAPGGTNHASQGQQAPVSATATGSQPGYAGQPSTTTTSSYPAQGTPPSGYGLPPPQPGYGSQPPPPQSGYGQNPYAQPGYQQPQGQKAPPTSAYGQAPPPGSTQASYMQQPAAQPSYSHGQPGSGAPQAGYGLPQAYSGAPPSGNAGYGQQQAYGDSYSSGAYSQTAAYSNEATANAPHDQSASAPDAPGGGGTQGSPN